MTRSPASAWQSNSIRARRSADPDALGLRIGVVGLGAGTVAALATGGGQITFYDINPDVIRIAQEYFYYLADTRAKWNIVEGDARLTLEADCSRRPGQKV